ncbi:hypothetical protein CMI37_39035 [Candidatus Pacearchaeota archaeon]|nr:hypothetical protein [Candidatus Pacearchaeota archaeon]
MNILTAGDTLWCPICGENIKTLKLSFTISEASPVVAEVDFKKERVLAATALPKTLNIEDFVFYCPQCNYNISSMINSDDEQKYAEMVMSVAKLKHVIGGDENEV